MGRESLGLLQGTVDVLILRTLAWASMHGYGISRWINDRSEGALAVEDAALYQALHRLERKGLVESEWGVSEKNHRAKYYSLRAKGRQQLRARASSWDRYSSAVSKVIHATVQPSAS